MDSLEQNIRLPVQHKCSSDRSRFLVFQRWLGILQPRRKKRLDSPRAMGTTRLEHSLEDNRLKVGNQGLEGIRTPVMDIWNCLNNHRLWMDNRFVVLPTSIQVEKHIGPPARRDPAKRHLDAGLFGIPDTGHLQIC